jgi:hypothetical protein
VAFLLSVGASTASAQNYSAGIKAGVNFANINIEGDGVDVSFDNRTGLVAGGFVVWPVNTVFGVQTEALYSQKGAKIEEDGATGTLKLDFLEVPVLARFSSPASNGASFHVFGGPSFGFRLRARSESEFEGDSESEDISDDVERFDLGLVAGAGVEMGRLVVDGRYTWGMTNLNKDPEDDVKIKNRVFSIMAGIRF